MTSCIDICLSLLFSKWSPSSLRISNFMSYQTPCHTMHLIRFLKSHNQVVNQLDLQCHDNKSFYSDILRLDSTNADALYVRGLCLYYEDCIDKAVQFFIQALRMAPDHEKARLACRVWLICFSNSFIMISLLRWFNTLQTWTKEKNLTVIKLCYETLYKNVNIIQTWWKISTILFFSPTSECKSIKSKERWG